MTPEEHDNETRAELAGMISNPDFTAGDLERWMWGRMAERFFLFGLPHAVRLLAQRKGKSRFSGGVLLRDGVEVGTLAGMGPEMVIIDEIWPARSQPGGSASAEFVISGDALRGLLTPTEAPARAAAGRAFDWRAVQRAVPRNRKSGSTGVKIVKPKP